MYRVYFYVYETCLKEFLTRTKTLPTAVRTRFQRARFLGFRFTGMDISDIFESELVQWGLRGDPLLWRDMAKKLSNQKMPRTSTELEKN